MPSLAARRKAQRAERLVQREYEELREPTLRALRARLGAQGIRVADADLDAFYNQAWHGLYEQLLRGGDVENRGGFLVVAGYRRAIEDLRRQHPDRQADAVAAEELGDSVDLAAQLDDRLRLSGVMQGMRERLSERERQAAALCYLHGYTRPEAAAALGLAPRRMEKLMDGVSGKLGALTTEIDEGDWCESRQSLMKAYAYGVLDPDGERYAIARAHLEECPACRKYVRGLRGIAVAVPPVWLPLAALGLLGLGGASAATAAGIAHAGAGGAAAAGSGAAGAGGAGAGAGAGGGAAGGWGAAAAASVAIAAGGIGAYAVVSGGGDKAKPPAPPPAVRQPATTAAKPAPKPKPKPKAKPAPKPAPAPAATPAPVVPAAEPAPVTTAEPAPPPAPESEREFGFER